MADKAKPRSATGDELRSIIATARGTERDGKKFYLALAAKTPNPLARRMFEGLAEAEGEHLKLIDKLAAGEFKPVAYKRGMFVRKLASVFAEMPESVRQQAKAVSSDTQALKVALEMEDKSLAFYREWAAKAVSKEARVLCERLAAEEEDHWKLLRGTLDYLNETGDWYMAQEHWSFDGG